MYSHSDGDPYNSSKREIESEIEQMKAFLERYRQLLTASSKSQKEEFEWVKGEIKKALKKVDFEIREIEKSIEIVEQNKEKFSHIVPQLKGRKEFVDEIRATLKKVQSDMSEKEREKNKTKINEKKKIFGNKSKYAQLEELNRRENEEFIKNEFQKHELIEKKTKEGLGKIIVKVGGIRAKAEGLGDEVDEHDRVLRELDRNVEKADNLLQRVTKKTKSLIKKGGNAGLVVCIILLIIVLVVLVFLLFFVNF